VTQCTVWLTSASNWCGSELQNPTSCSAAATSEGAPAGRQDSCQQGPGRRSCGTKHGGTKHGGTKHGGTKHGGTKHGGTKHGGIKTANLLLL